MSIGSSGKAGGLGDHSQGWNDPNGLGWQLWRRAQSTGLLVRQVQRQLARLRISSLSSRHSLASEIRGRWGLGRGSRSGGDLPLFLRRFRWFGPSRWQSGPTVEPGAASRPANIERPLANTLRTSSLDVVARSREATARPSTRADNTAYMDSSWLRGGLDPYASPSPRGPAPERAASRRPAEASGVSASRSIEQGPNVVAESVGDAAGVPAAAPVIALTPERGDGQGVVVANSGATRAETPFVPVSREPGGPIRSGAMPSTPFVPVFREPGGPTRSGAMPSTPFVPLSRELGGPTRSGAMPSTLSARPSLPSAAPVIVVHEDSINRGITRISRAVAEPWIPPAGLLVLPVSRPSPSEPPRISRTVFVTPRPAATGAERTAAGHDTITLTLRSRGTPPPTLVSQPGVVVTHQVPPANVLTVREGMAVSPVARSAARFVGLDRALAAGRMGVSVGSGESPFAVALAGLDWPSVERFGPVRTPDPILSHRTRSSGGSGAVPRLDARRDDRALDGSGPGVGAVARFTEPRFAAAVSSGSAEGWIERKATIGELMWTVDSSEARPSTGGGGQQPAMTAMTPSVGVVGRVYAPTTTLGGGSAPPSGAGSSAPSSGFAAIIMDRGSPVLVERAVARRTALERGFETLHLASHRESQPSWFLAHQGRPPLGGAPARSVSRYGARWPTAPALVARSPGIRTNSADQLPDAGTLPPAIGSMEIVALGWGSDVRPVASVGRPQTPGPTAVIATMRSMTLSRPALRTVEIPADGPPRQAALPGATGERELLLAARPGPAAGDHVTAIQRASEFSVQAAASTPTVSAEGRAPVGAVVGARVGGTQADASSARIDLDELVDRAWQKLMHKVTIEQERRGYTR